MCSAIVEADELSSAMKKIMTAGLSEMGRRSREYFEKHFDKQMLMDQMDVYSHKGLNIA